MLAMGGCQTAPKPSPTRLNASVAVVRPAASKPASPRKKKVAKCSRDGTGLTQERKDELFRKFTAEQDPAADAVLSAAEPAPPDAGKNGLPPCPQTGR